MFLKKLFSYIILFGANRLILSGKYLILLHFYYVFKEFIMILSCSNICKSFGENDILKQVSFHIEDHEKAAIVGINGAGKSTLLKVLIGKLNADDGVVTWAKGASIGYLAQHQDLEGAETIYDALLEVKKPVIQMEARIRSLELEMKSASGDELETKLSEYSRLNHEFEMADGYSYQSEITGVLKGLGFTEDEFSKPITALSGGQKTRVSLGKLLLTKPDILLLDEPTNHLDLDAIEWLEEFLINFENTVIVVSHDRYFLNKVCTHTADIDYGKIQLYAGNYDFWYESSQLMIRQMKEANRKKEEKIKELQEFISRFSANASKSKQATSRKRALEKIQLDDMRPSSRKYPYIDFRPEREIGNDVLFVEGISKTIDGVKVLDNISFTVNHDDKIAFVGGNELAKTTMFKILAGELEPDEGSYKWGVTTSQSYFPKDNTTIFDTDELIVDWLTQYSEIKDATYVRGFLGRMLFAGEDGVKKMRVLSGGEKVRVLLSRMMIMGSNVLMFDEPTDHLDMESITALNNGMIKFPGVILFACRDHQVVQTTANRIIEFLPNGSMIDKITTYDEYLESDEMARKRQVYSMSEDDENDN